MQTVASTKPTSVRPVATAQKAHNSIFAPLKKHFGAAALVGGLLSAQIAFMPGPAVADVYSQPSIDQLSVVDAEDILAEVESAEIPQLQARLGYISGSKAQPIETVAAAERQLEEIETEVAALDEEAIKGPTSEFTSETGGLLSQITSLKSMMRGMQ